ncbi:MAG: TIGR04282 family arsenosugar biosynthesis glycosyltransferase [Desulfovibrionaceae bacterium]|nr:TIGR04282 family arsenosugar biosynthesis glycosyltransferase [Desulfovibrionaceae bacterium]
MKTRLARELRDAAALAIHEACILDMLDMLGALGPGLQVAVYCHPARQAARVSAWLGGGTVFGQRGNDLGERMLAALRESFDNGSDAAMIVGGDVPELHPDVLRRAAFLLAESPAVLGPAADGGYYLIGFTRQGLCPQAFEAIPWGGPDVLARTLDALSRQGVTPALLPGLRDLDRLADVLALAAKAGPGEAAAPRTRALARKILERGEESGEQPFVNKGLLPRTPTSQKL